MTNIYNSKKSQAAKNIFVGIIFLLTFAFMSIIGVLVTNEVLTTWESTSAYDADSMANPIKNFRFGLSVFDYLSAIFMIVFIVGIAVTSFKLATAPIFFIVTFVMSAIYGFVSYLFNYIFIQFISEAVLSSVIASFPITILICTNLHWVALALIVVGAIALYAKKPQGQFLQ